MRFEPFMERRPSSLPGLLHVSLPSSWTVKKRREPDQTTRTPLLVVDGRYCRLARSPQSIPGIETPYLEADGLTFGRSRVDKAGRAMRKDTAREEDFEVANAFRRSHSQPLLSVRMSVSSFTTTVGIDGFELSQRLKRIDRIQNKLRRESVRLTQLQDIAGVRIVVPTLTAQARLKDRAKEQLGSQIDKVDDYVAGPKTSGYRAIHIVVKRSNRLVEIQIRTLRQHEWADTMEQVGRDMGTEVKWLSDPIDEAVEYSRLLAEADAAEDLDPRQDRFDWKE